MSFAKLPLPPTGADVRQASTTSDKLSLLYTLSEALTTSKSISASSVLDDAVLVDEIGKVWAETVVKGSSSSGREEDEPPIKLLLALTTRPQDAARLYSLQSASLLPGLLRRMESMEVENEHRGSLRATLCFLVKQFVLDSNTAQRLLADYPDVFPRAFSLATAAIRNSTTSAACGAEMAAEMITGVLDFVLVLAEFSPDRVLARSERQLVELLSVLGEILVRDSLQLSSAALVSALVSELAVLYRLQRLVVEAAKAASGVLPGYLALVPALCKMLGDNAHRSAGQIDWFACYHCITLLRPLRVLPGMMRQFASDDDLVRCLLDMLMGLLGRYCSKEVEMGGQPKHTHGQEDDDHGPACFFRQARDFISSLVTDRGNAQHVLARHESVLLPLMAVMLNEVRVLHFLSSSSSSFRPGLFSDDDYGASAAALVHSFSCPVSNQQVMRGNAGLMAALNKVQYAEDIAVWMPIMLTRINLLRPLPFYMIAITTVYALLLDAFENDLSLPISSSLLAWRYLAAGQENRDAFWREYGTTTTTSAFVATMGSDGPPLAMLPLILKVLEHAVGRNRLDAAEDGIAVLVQFAADEEPHKAMCRRDLLAAITKLVNHAALVGTPAGRAGKLLMMRLKSAPPPPALPPAHAAAVNSHSPNVLHTEVASKGSMNVSTALELYRWDDFIACLQHDEPVVNKDLLGRAMAKSAPLRVIQYLVVEKKADVNEPFLRDSPRSPLIHALRCGDVDTALFLLDHGADGSRTDYEGYTALMASCLDAKLLPVTRKLVAQCTRAEVAYQAPPQHQDGQSTADTMTTATTTALSLCVQFGSVEQVKLLLDAGAISDDDGRQHQPPPPRLILTALSRENLSIIRLVAEHGADLHDVGYATASLIESLRNGAREHVAEDLLLCYLDLFVARDVKYKTDPFVTSPALFGEFYAVLQPFPPRVMRRWLELGADVTMASQWAAGHDNTADVALFLQLGADPNYMGGTGPRGGTPLLAAVARGVTRENVGIARMLIRAGADVEAKMDAGRPPGMETSINALFMAAGNNNMEMVTLLLQAGADCNATVMNDGQLMQFGGASTPDLPRLLAAKAVQLGEFGEELGFEFTMCAHCRRNRGLLEPCSGCVMVAYCDEECQRAHWAKHKPVCKKKREMQAKRRR